MANRPRPSFTLLKGMALYTGRTLAIMGGAVLLALAAGYGFCSPNDGDCAPIQAIQFSILGGGLALCIYFAVKALWRK